MRRSLLDMLGSSADHFAPFRTLRRFERLRVRSLSTSGSHYGDGMLGDKAAAGGLTQKSEDGRACEGGDDGAGRKRSAE